MPDNKGIVEEIIKEEKIAVLVYPVVVPTFFYGLWLFLYPSILQTYKVYTLVNDVLQSWQIGSLFMIVSVLSVIFYKFYNRRILLIINLFTLFLWSFFAVAFVSTPPPNTVWIFASTMTYLTFSLTRRI